MKECENIDKDYDHEDDVAVPGKLKADMELEEGDTVKIEKGDESFTYTIKEFNYTICETEDGTPLGLWYLYQKWKHGEAKPPK